MKWILIASLLALSASTFASIIRITSTQDILVAYEDNLPGKLSLCTLLSHFPKARDGQHSFVASDNAFKFRCNKRGIVQVIVAAKLQNQTQVKKGLNWVSVHLSPADSLTLFKGLNLSVISSQNRHTKFYTSSDEKLIISCGQEMGHALHACHIQIYTN